MSVSIVAAMWEHAPTAKRSMPGPCGMQRCPRHSRRPANRGDTVTMKRKNRMWLRVRIRKQWLNRNIYMYSGHGFGALRWSI